MEKILFFSKRTGLHDDVLKILLLHMDPILPLPRLRMISVMVYLCSGTIIVFEVSFVVTCTSC